MSDDNGSNPSTKISRGATVAIAIISAATSIGVAATKGYFDLSHIDPRLENLRGIDVQSGLWATILHPDCKILGNPLAEGLRACTWEVGFDRRFNAVPTVFTSVNLINYSTTNNPDWKIDIDPDQGRFKISVTALGDAVIHDLEGQWIAFHQ